MLNKNRSNKLKAWKFSLVLPFLAYFLVAFNTKTVTRANTPPNLQESLLEHGSTDTTKVEFIINKTSTEEDLEKISNTLKNNYIISQSFADIQRNQKGLIINISSSLTVSKADKSIMTGTNTFNDPNGIEPFSIYVEADKDMKVISMGHETSKKDNLEGLSKHLKNRTINNESKTMHNEKTTVDPIDPLYVVDGEVTTSSKAKNIDPSEVNKVNVLKGVTATNKYGEKGKNGVLEITTKGYYNTMNLTKTTGSIQQYNYNYIKSDKEPLFIVDGVEKEADFNFGTIPPSSIESMKVVKGEEAIQKFGKKGGNGVVELTLKKSNWNVGAGTNTNDPNTNSNWNALPAGSVESIDAINSEDGTSPNSKWKVSYTLNMNDPNDIYDLSPFRQNGMEKATIFVNGVHKGKNYVPTMKYSEVESTGTFRPSAETTKKYGKIGKHGVIEIITRKN